MKVLLLNPPGKELYLRDYYCSKVSKANYINQPTDFVILSGIISKKHTVIILDSIIEKLSEGQALARIKEILPQVIVFLSGSVSLTEDMDFMYKVKRITNARLIGSGDIFMEDAKTLLEQYSFIDAAILDFTSDEILKWIDNIPCKNIVYRNDGILLYNKQEYQVKCTIPCPKHDLFKNKLYKYPFIKREPFATVLTTFGCPFKCTFCIMGNLPFKMRKIDDIIYEIQFLKRLGINEVYFNDQTFGIDEKRTLKLLELITPLNITWVCFSRVDIMTYSLLIKMKEAGCHTIMFGVESGNQQIIDNTMKCITKELIITTFNLCNKLNINTLATFILGLPGDTMTTCLETIQFAKKIDCDYASFNVATPRMMTTLRRQSIEKGFIAYNQLIMDQSGSSIPMRNESLSIMELDKLLKKAYRDFYLRPGYIAKRLSKINTWAEFRNHFRQLVGLLGNKIL